MTVYLGVGVGVFLLGWTSIVLGIRGKRMDGPLGSSWSLIILGIAGVIESLILFVM